MTPEAPEHTKREPPVREAPRTFTETSPVAPVAEDRDEAAASDAVKTLERMERVLGEIRGALDASAREERHKEFSPIRLVGAIVQVIVVGLLGLAVVDWIFEASFDTQFVKLAYAAVLQLTALTAFVVAPRER